MKALAVLVEVLFELTGLFGGAELHEGLGFAVLE